MPRAFSEQRETSQIAADSRSSDATETLTPAARTADGPEGNARLTASTGALAAGIILGTVILPTVGPWNTQLAHHDDRQTGSVGQIASQASLIAARAAR